MRTVHETEALRPSDPVPKHHSSNPTNKSLRLRLVLNNDTKKEKGSTPATPASPSSHSHPLNSATVPLSADVEYAHHNVIYMQDLGSPGAPTMVQFPPDMNFTAHELSLPAPDLFRLLRRQLLWAQQEGDQLRLEAEALEKKRKEEWVTKELLLENHMEGELAKMKRKRLEAGLLDEPQGYDLMEEDIGPAKMLEIEPKAGKIPWWREESWLQRMADVKEAREAKQSIPEQALPLPEPQQEAVTPDTRAVSEAA